MAVFGLRHPKVGDPVVWYPEGNTEQAPTPGIVVLPGQHAVDIVCHSEHGGHILKQSVWHIHDKKIQENENVRKAGGWDYAPHFRDMLDLQALLQQIRKNQENNAKRRQMKRSEAEAMEAVEEATEPEEVAAGADE